MKPESSLTMLATMPEVGVTRRRSGFRCPLTSLLTEQAGYPSVVASGCAALCEMRTELFAEPDAHEMRGWGVKDEDAMLQRRGS
jgi:hypothetical protein